jgi:hypothetical protein
MNENDAALDPAAPRKFVAAALPPPALAIETLYP